MVKVAPRAKLAAPLGAAFVVIAVAASCGPHGGDVPFLRTERCTTCAPDAGKIEAGNVPIPDEPKEPWDETGAGPLTGIFAVQAVISARVVHLLPAVRDGLVHG